MPDRHIDFALIGGGVAAANCARHLRREGADGTIAIIGREPDLPYERPPLSKGYLAGQETRDSLLLRDADYYAEQEIETLTRVSALRLDAEARTIKLSDRREVSFGQALIATGAGVQRLRVDGAELEGIHYLRTIGNSDAIRTDAAGKEVVIVGGSYLACELAATLTTLGSRCTMVMLESLPLSRGFGETAGRWFGELLRGHGVTLHPEQALAAFTGADGRVTGIRTETGLELPADVVVLGTGATPDVMLARAAGLALGETGGVAVDSRLRTSAPQVFAAGDMAEYDSVVHGRRLRVEHWDVAFQQGKVAALNMLGRDVAYDVVPYFFSDLADWASIEYVGPATRWEREVVRGDLDEGRFAVFYLDTGRVVAALSVGRAEDLGHARRMLNDAVDLAGAEASLADLSVDLTTLV